MKVNVLIYFMMGLYAKFISAEDGFDEEGMDGYNAEGVSPPNPYDAYGSGGGDPYGGGGDPYGGGGYGGGDPYGGGGYGGGYGDAGGRVSAKELSSVDEISAFLKEEESEAIVLGYFDEMTHGDAKETFEQVASSEGNLFKFAYTTSKGVLEEMKCDGSLVYVYKPAKLVSSKYEKPRSRYPSKTLKAESLQKFIYDKALPLVGEMSFKNADLYERSKVPVVTAYTDVNHEKNEQGFTYVANRVRKVAATYKNKFVFNIADKSTLPSEIGSLSASAMKRGDVSVVLRAGEQLYGMETKFSTETLSAFLDAYKQGSLVGVERMSRAPEAAHHDEASHGGGDGDVDDSHVVHLTDANFDSVVNENKNDVMVEFYAPWCGHCKSLKPEYATLANAFAQDDSVTISAMDATAHTVPAGFDVQGYPTVYFVPGDSKVPVTYEGPRTASDMRSFIDSHRTTTPV